MSDLIRRSDAMGAVQDHFNADGFKGYDDGQKMLDRLKALPSAEPNTGEWMLKEHLWECDQCGCRINRAKPLKGNIWNYNFCPNCGAKMYKGGDDE